MRMALGTIPSTPHATETRRALRDGACGAWCRVMQYWVFLISREQKRTRDRDHCPGPGFYFSDYLPAYRYYADYASRE